MLYHCYPKMIAAALASFFWKKEWLFILSTPALWSIPQAVQVEKCDIAKLVCKKTTFLGLRNKLFGAFPFFYMKLDPSSNKHNMSMFVVAIRNVSVGIFIFNSRITLWLCRISIFIHFSAEIFFESFINKIRTCIFENRPIHSLYRSVTLGSKGRWLP